MSDRGIRVSHAKPHAALLPVTAGDWRGVILAPLLILVVLSAVVVGFSIYRRSHQRERLQSAVDANAATISNLLQSRLEATASELRAFRDRLRDAPDRIPATFPPLARSLASRQPGVRSLQYVDASGSSRHSYPLRASSLEEGERDIAHQAQWRAAWAAASSGGVDAMTGYRLTPNELQIRCVLPLIDASPDPTVIGGVFARVNIEKSVILAFESSRNDFWSELTAGDTVLYGVTPASIEAATQPVASLGTLDASRANGGKDNHQWYFTADGLPIDRKVSSKTELARRWDLSKSPFTSTREIHLFGAVLRIQTAASDSMIARMLDRSPWTVGVWGILGSLVVSGLFSQFMYSRAVHDRRRREYLSALERLNEIATAISARLGVPRDMLDQLAVAARDLLQVDRSGICLLSPNGGGVRVVAVAGDIPASSASEFSMADLPMCREVLKSRRPIFIGDVGRAAEDMNSDVAALFNARSLMLLPLVTSEQQLGIMALSSSKPREFSDEQKRLAELLASKAAVILSNSELYSRMAEALRTQQMLFEQREAIFAVNAAVYQAATLNESLQMIAELAPGVLGVDLCIVTLTVENNDDGVRIAAITKPSGADLTGMVLSRRGTNGEVVRLTRRTLVIEDARGHPGVQPLFQSHLNIGSVAYLPLLRPGGAFMGTLVLVRHEPGPFAPEQLSLAELFTVRAAAAVENAELLEQTRRDTQAKTMLLRELNHRVKNNLASIITLLSLDEPEMSAKARKWLRRAIERIRTMARTHDLFSGGMERVSLVDLIQQTIPSLSVVRPPTVVIESDVQANVHIRTDRAVSLAMVLHELCYNAIIHGLGNGAGAVMIRAQMENGKEIVNLRTPPVKGVLIEVIDSGGASRREPLGGMQSLVSLGALESGLGDEPAVAAAVLEPETRIERVGSGGLGLLLVDGLVTRELNGEFALIRGEGKTVARVWFPVAAEDRSA